MLDQDIHHLLVTSPDGALLGMVEGNDLLALDAHSPFHMRTAIAEAATLDDCIAATAGLRPTVIALHDGRLHASYITQVTSILITTLSCRLVDLAVAEHGGKPAEFVWLALGSLARNEVMPSSDFDCAIAWEGCDTDPELRAWMRGVAAEVIAGLEACGFRETRATRWPLIRCSRGRSAPGGKPLAA
jgi:CBS domain-containing protein